MTLSESSVALRFDLFLNALQHVRRRADSLPTHDLVHCSRDRPSAYWAHREFCKESANLVRAFLEADKIAEGAEHPLLTAHVLLALFTFPNCAMQLLLERISTKTKSWMHSEKSKMNHQRW